MRLPLVLPLALALAAAACRSASEPAAGSARTEDAAAESAGDELADLPPAPRSDEPERVDDFALLDQEGRLVRLFEPGAAEPEDFFFLWGDAEEQAPPTRAVVLVSYAVGCPILRWTLPRVEELARDYGPRGVRFLYVDASPQDTRADLREEVREFGLTVPILSDSAQIVLGSLGVRRTAEAILVDAADGRIAYRGKVHDGATYGSQSGGTKRELLQEALDALLDGRAPEVPRTEAEGCLILYESAGEPVPSYAADVAPILERRCTSCHHKGGIGPWAMSSYERVRGWAPMMREVVRTRRMPPWHADPEHGEFSNDGGLTPEETSALVRWIEAGAPRGAGPDPLLAREARPEPKWPMGEPDLVLPGRRWDLPATGLVPYLYDEVELDVEEDLWVRAVQIRPSNAAVLHHAFVLVFYPDHLKHLEPEYVQGAGSYFALYVPGKEPHPFPPGTGKWIPAGSRVLVQYHYITTGRPEHDEPELALYLLDEPPDATFVTSSVVQWELDIPPGASHYEAKAEKRLEEDVVLYELIPHMHYRGAEFGYEVRYPDGRSEVLLSVPAYDFNWQTAYRLAEPKLLPAGTVVECRAVFDNSAKNPYNPDPTAWVIWGPQSTDEMFIGYMNYRVAPSGGGGAGEAPGR